MIVVLVFMHTVILWSKKNNSFSQQQQNSEKNLETKKRQKTERDRLLSEENVSHRNNQ